jgi:hypothetical protein
MWVQKTAPASRDAGAGWRTDLLTSPFRLYAGRNENQILLSAKNFFLDIKIRLKPSLGFQPFFVIFAFAAKHQ